MAWIEKKGNKYRGRYKDPNTGRNVSTPVQTSRRAALQLAQDQEMKIRNGGWVNPQAGKITFGAYFVDHWLPNRVMELNTRRTYESHFRAALEPAFGGVQLRRITRTMVQAWVRQMQDDGVKPSTIKARYKALGTILGAQSGVSAVSDELIATTPCRRIQLPTAVEREVEIFEPEEIRALLHYLASCENGWWMPLVWLAYESGMRWGELIALRPSDIDEAGTITVARTIIESAKSETGTGTRFRLKHYPKSGKPRSLTVSRELANYLNRIALERDIGPLDLLFTMPQKPESWHAPLMYRLVSRRTDEWPGGQPISRSHFRDVWKRVLAIAGLRHRRFHDLRGTHISWMLRGHADYPAVMQRVGHKDVTTTQRYTQAGAAADQRALEAFMRSRGAGPES